MNRIRGTVSFTGRARAFSSARSIRFWRMSWEKTERVSPRLVPMSSAWRSMVAKARASSMPRRSAKAVQASLRDLPARSSRVSMRRWMVRRG